MEVNVGSILGSKKVQVQNGTYGQKLGTFVNLVPKNDYVSWITISNVCIFKEQFSYIRFYYQIYKRKNLNVS